MIFSDYIRDVYRCEQTLILRMCKHAQATRNYRQELNKLPEVATFVISFPKSGRTWHRVMLGAYLCHCFNKPLESAADVYQLTAGLPTGRVLYWHNMANFIEGLPATSAYVADSRKWAGKRVIFIVRNPRDVLVSAWYHAKFRQNVYSGDLGSFIRSPSAGIEKILVAHNRWWRDRNKAANHLFLSYEAMTDDPFKALESTVRFLGLPDVDAAAAAKAIEFSSFGRMREAEELNLINHPSLLAVSDSPNARKVRSGRVGGYKDEMSAEDIAFVDREISRLGDPFSTYYRRSTECSNLP